jgi:hypothetical protein
MMVVLLGEADGEFCVRPEQVSELARLGVTNLALVRDDRIVGIVLEGWLFDPAGSAEAAALAVGAGGRTLHPVLHMAVSAMAPEGGRDVRDISHARA